ncbi:MAG: polyprenyl synthetase family protein [Armatimonadota bacterium]|nr:polyprenyl synthetase family protein [bacterium]
MNAHALHTREETQPGWVAPVETQLDLVERKLESVSTSDIQTAFDLSIYMFSAGGKRVRPALVLLSALASNAEADECRVVNLAAATELVHTASLIHDDVVDETSERRGVKTANFMWGNKMSVLGGDFLLSKAFSLLAADSDSKIMRVLSSMAIGMGESEMLQAESEGDIDAWQRNYWRIIRGKTASFLSACCECGAMVAGADASTRDSLVEYGLQIGTAFQITDDVLDIVGDPLETGKDIGSDLTHGKFTLPVLLAIQDARVGKDILSLLRRGELTPDQACEVANVVADCGAVEKARESARNCAHKACEQLATIPTSAYTQALESLAEFVINRVA